MHKLVVLLTIIV